MNNIYILIHKQMMHSRIIKKRKYLGLMLFITGLKRL